MNAPLIYLLLLKATITSFAGMGSLPQIRQDFVETHRAISDEQLSQAVLVGRATIGDVAHDPPRRTRNPSPKWISEYSAYGNASNPG